MRTRPLTASPLWPSCCPPSFPLYPHALRFLTLLLGQLRQLSLLSPRLCDASEITFTLFFTLGGSSAASEPHRICSLHSTHCEHLGANRLHNHRARSRGPCQAALTAGLRGPAWPAARRYLQCPLFQVTHSEAFWPNCKSWLPPIPPRGVNAAGAVERLPAPALWLRLPSADIRGRESSS